MLDLFSNTQDWPVQDGYTAKVYVAKLSQKTVYKMSTDMSPVINWLCPQPTIIDDFAKK